MSGLDTPLGFDLSGATRGTTLTTAAAANTKGTIVELVSAAGHTNAWSGFYVGLTNATTNDTYAVDIMVGAVAAETVLFPDLDIRTTTTSNASYGWVYVPLAVAASVRVGARVMSSSASARTMDIVLVPHLSGATAPEGYTAAVKVFGGDYGVVVNGDNVTANTPGAITQLLASTAGDYGAFLWKARSPGVPGARHGAHAQLFTGASSSEVLLGAFLHPINTQGDTLFGVPQMVRQNVASGTRLSAQVQTSSITDYQLTFSGWAFTPQLDFSGGGAGVPATSFPNGLLSR